MDGWIVEELWRYFVYHKLKIFFTINSMLRLPKQIQSSSTSALHLHWNLTGLRMRNSEDHGYTYCHHANINLSFENQLT